MIDTSDKCLLMIEPQLPPTAPMEDALTALARGVFGTAKSGDVWCKGFHTCSCGKHSDNQIWTLPDGRETNSLMIHYIAEHRAEVPQSELNKLNEWSYS